MKSVRYVGPSGPGVEVVHPDPAMPGAGTVTVCKPGEVVELPDNVADAHLKAGTFELAEKQRRTTKATATEPQEED